MSTSYFTLFTNCFLTKGHAGSVIVDVHRNRYLPIKNEIATLLENDLTSHTVAQVKTTFPDLQEGLDAYLNHFVENEYGFYTDAPQNFPPIDLQYHHPGHLANAIIAIEGIEQFDYRSLLLELLELGCWHFQLLLLAEQYDTDKLAELISVFETSIARSVDLRFKYDCLTFEQYKALSFPDLRVISTVYGQSAETSHYINAGTVAEKYDNVFLHYVTRALDYQQPESYDESLFYQTLAFYTEAQSHNPGLNKKVCIDPEGNIKNYFTHAKSFGNISKDAVSSVIQQAGFQEKWHLGNDKLEKCKACQFRYMCLSYSDITYQDDSYQKVEDCTFDPFTNSWA